MILNVRDNLFIRSLSEDDAPVVYNVVDDNRLYLRRWLPWVDATDSEALLRDVIDDWEKRCEKGSDIVGGIFTSGKYIGNIGLHDINTDKKTAVVGYWLAEAFQGGGIMTDCVRSLINYAFDRLGMNTVCIHCAVGNNKSRALPLRLGFTESGVLKGGETLYGITHDMIIYSLDRRRS